MPRGGRSEAESAEAGPGAAAPPRPSPLRPAASSPRCLWRHGVGAHVGRGGAEAQAGRGSVGTLFLLGVGNMGDPGPEVVDSVSPSRPEVPASAAEENEDDIQFVSEGPLRPVLEYIDLVSSDDEEPSTSYSDRMPASKVPSSENHRSSCSVPLPIGDSSSSSGSCASSPQRIVSQLSSVENPLENQKNDQNNSDNKISETESLKLSQNYQTLPSSPLLVPQESLDSSEIKEDLPIESSASQHGQDAILYLQTQVAEMSRVIRDLQSKSCFRFHHSRPNENSSVPWDLSTSKEENLSTGEEADCKSPTADEKGQPTDPAQSSFTGLLKRMEQRGVIKRVTLQSETELCEGKPDCVTSKKRLVPPLHPLLRIATTEVFKDPADCHPSSFMGHRVYPVSRDTSPFQPNPPAEGPIVEALEHSKRGSTTSPLDSTSKEMEVMGCRFYHAASIAARAASYMAYMTQYQRKLWEDMEDLVHNPQFDRGKARCIISDGMDAGLWQLCTTRDIMDSVVRVMAMAIDYRRQAWLRLTSLSKKTQDKVLHLPFDGTSLFGQDVNAVVAEENSIKENDYKDHNKYYNQHRYFNSHDQKAYYHSRGYSRGDWYKPRSHPYRYRKKGDSPERHGYKN
ncbi:E3 SUMO-protein ligase ZNF451 isoform X7 [Heterocephalus glaber]|uniref:E3 SUMO-protein ligase ZNF451 isoform X7 n=1 Tax=Heterocephalus glaber TaxID=10181 RepID=A0AAX6P8H7_HETGA|nr:E3 SUMO-protein ligase ZNF451 isoform X7 [Heterocephalus glaber]